MVSVYISCSMLCILVRYLTCTSPNKKCTFCESCMYFTYDDTISNNSVMYDIYWSRRFIGESVIYKMSGFTHDHGGFFISIVYLILWQLHPILISWIVNNHTYPNSRANIAQLPSISVHGCHAIVSFCVFIDVIRFPYPISMLVQIITSSQMSPRSAVRLWNQ